MSNTTDVPATIVSSIAALISLGAIVAQYLLLPRPYMVVEDERIEDGTLKASVFNRGNATAYDLRFRYVDKKLSRAERAGMKRSFLLAQHSYKVEPGEQYGFGLGTGKGIVCVVTWRQAPFMRCKRTKCFKVKPKVIATSETRGGMSAMGFKPIKPKK